jgi:very-short-patch-repair endonuclease
VAGFWTDLPMGRVVSLGGISADEIILALEPLPDDAPAIVTLRPSGPPAIPWSSFILDELDACARALFPVWLPGAGHVDGLAGLGLAAVRAIAARAAGEAPDHGPFLADLAARALGDRSAGHPRFAEAVRASGLARVIAASYQRSSLALVVDVPASLPSTDELVAACERLTHTGRFGVWLTGAIPASGRVATVGVGPYMPTQVRPAAPAPVVTFPPIAGRPHPASLAERALENALALREWATGRAWNQIYDMGPLANPVRLDLLWPAERCVVEVDGPEHCAEPRYEADRRRDVDLQLAGYAVLRFTNAQIHQDVHAVIDRIERFLRARRSALVQKG